MTKYSKQQKVEKRTRKIKTNENETDARAMLKRAQKRRPITCSECTTRTYKKTNTHTHTQRMHVYTHTPTGDVGKSARTRGQQININTNERKQRK